MRFPILFAAVVLPLAGQDFVDGFEAPTLNPFWTPEASQGAVLTTEQKRTGARAVRLEGGLGRTFLQPVKGSIAAWFYDPGPDAASFGYLYLFNTQTGAGSAILLSGNCYLLGAFDSNGIAGPNGTCDDEQFEFATSIRRTTGWHRLAIRYEAAQAVFQIDQQTVFTANTNLSFDAIYLLGFGTPSFYVDDFEFSLTGGATSQLVVNPPALSFFVPPGATAAQEQILQVDSTGVSLPLSASAAVVSGNWQLSVSPNSGVAPAALTVRLQPGAGLAAGSYRGAVTLASPGRAAVTVPVNLTVSNCSVTVKPAAASVDLLGGAGSFDVATAPAGCAWFAASAVPWIRITSGAAGAGNGIVRFTVDGNPAGNRSGVIRVNDKTYTVNQTGIEVCRVTINPGSVTVAAPGGPGQFQVTSTCDWQAVTLASFVTITEPAGGAGANNGTVRFSVTANTGTVARAASILIGGQEFRISQNPAGVTCTYSLSRTALTIPAAGGAASLNVTAPAGCGWSSSDNADFLTITNGSNGSVDGVVTVTASANSGGQRSATLRVAGIDVAVTQESGAGCPAALTPPSATFRAEGSAAATVEVNSPCAWTAVSNAGFVTITAGASGSGPGTVSFRVDSATAPRNGTLTIAGQSFLIGQSGPGCLFALSAATRSVPAAGGVVEIQVTTTPACPWTSQITGSPGWLTLVSAGPGSGAGTVRLQAAANGAGERSATVRIAGQDVTVVQLAGQALSCTASSPSATVRAEGRTELVGNLVLQCQGTAAAAINGDIVVTLNTNVTSRAVPGASEALLLIGEPANPVSGATAFLGAFAANNAVRFSNVPLAAANSSGSRTLRILNLRADATVPGLGPQITARVGIQTPNNQAGIADADIVVAQRSAGVAAQIGTPVAGAGQTTLPVEFRELQANGFRLRLAANQNPSQIGQNYNSESGYVNTAALGEGVGVAGTATRLVVRLRAIPVGVRVVAPAGPAGGGAQLLSPDPNGAGLGALTGATSEIAVRNGEAVLTWEVTSAQPQAAETFKFNVQLPGASPAIAEQIRAASSAFLGPVGAAAQATRVEPVPRFVDPGAEGRSAAAVQVKGAFLGRAGLVRSPAARDLTGTRSFSLDTTLTCTSDGGCADPVIRGNFSQGASFRSCTATGSESCAGAGRDVTIQFPPLDPGESVTASLSAELRGDAAQGSLVQFQSAASSDFVTAVDVVQQCLSEISAFPQPPGAGISAEFTVYACGAWTLTSSTPWIRFSPASGTGNAVVRYTVDPNPGPGGRSATVTLSGLPPILVNQTIGEPSTGLRFVPVAPCRLADTRTGEGKTGAFGPPVLAAGGTRTFPVPQGGCGIPAGAQAYSINVTVVPAGAALAFVTVWPAGVPRPGASTLNSFDGKIVANAALVPAGAGGAISVYATDATHVIVDINGYFTP